MAITTSNRDLVTYRGTVASMRKWGYKGGIKKGNRGEIMKRICETIYYHPNEDGAKRERTVNKGVIKYNSMLYDYGVKDLRLMKGSIWIVCN